MRTQSMKRSLVVVGLALALPLGLTACGGGKPSKEEVKEGMVSILNESGFDAESVEAAGISKDAVDDYYNCVVEDLYDNVSDDTLKALADGDASAQMSAEDSPKFNEAARACMSNLGF